jgi:hypothetical protein
MNKTQRNIIAVVAASVLAVVAAHCSGCVLVQPEGEMTMEVDDGQQ